MILSRDLLSVLFLNIVLFPFLTSIFLVSIVFGLSKLKPSEVGYEASSINEVFLISYDFLACFILYDSISL